MKSIPFTAEEYQEVIDFCNKLADDHYSSIINPRNYKELFAIHNPDNFYQLLLGIIPKNLSKQERRVVSSLVRHGYWLLHNASPHSSHDKLSKLKWVEVSVTEKFYTDFAILFL